MQTSNLEPLAVSIADSCHISSLGRTSIYDLLNSGKLESVKIGRRRLVKLASLQALIAEAAK